MSVLLDNTSVKTHTVVNHVALGSIQLTYYGIFPQGHVTHVLQVHIDVLHVLQVHIHQQQQAQHAHHAAKEPMELERSQHARCVMQGLIAF